jgi:hypothetical protein
LGKGKVFGLSANEQENRASHQISEAYARKLGLFTANATYGRLSGLVNKGATIKSTRISEAFTLERYQETYGTRAMPLCAFDPSGRMYIYTIDNEFKLKADWLIVSLVTPETAEEKASREIGEETARLAKEAPQLNAGEDFRAEDEA